MVVSQIDGNFLQCGDTGGTPIWIVGLGTIVGNGENVAEDSQQFFDKNHRKLVMTKSKQDVVYSSGVRSLGSGENAVR